MDCGKSNGGYFLSSQENLNQISSCQTIYGDLQIVPGPGDSSFPSIPLPSTMTTITGALEFMGFYDETDATGSITAAGLTSLGSINAASTIIYTGMFENFTLPWGVGSNPGLLIYNFPSLKTLSFPALDSIGGDFLFALNPAVKNINGFPNLSKIGGNLNITGSFNSIDFPNLKSVGGAVNIQSTSSTFQCPTNLQTLGGVRGQCGTASTFGSNSTQNTPSNVPPERYELCKTDAEVLSLQQTYGLIEVLAQPTRAALQPAWPETLISIGLGIYAVIVALGESQHRTAKPSLLLVGIPVVVVIDWIISFAFIEHDQATGGWLSVTAATVTANFAAWANESGHHSIGSILLLVWSFQGAGSFALFVQRWKGTVGSVAYLIIDSSGCTPHDGFGYLQQGARSRAFKIIQSTEVFFCSLVLSGITLFSVGSFLPGATVEPGAHKTVRASIAVCLIFIYIPVIIYESIIAVKGRPVVISGNCMLVELDPKWGFYDSEIEVWWKILVSLCGL